MEKERFAIFKQLQFSVGIAVPTVFAEPMEPGVSLQTPLPNPEMRGMKYLVWLTKRSSDPLGERVARMALVSSARQTTRLVRVPAYSPMGIYSPHFSSFF